MHIQYNAKTIISTATKDPQKLLAVQNINQDLNYSYPNLRTNKKVQNL